MTMEDLNWVQSRLRNCTNARRQLRICAECLCVDEGPCWKVWAMPVLTLSARRILRISDPAARLLSASTTLCRRR